MSIYPLILGTFIIGGLLIGSFLNVLILRYNTGKGIGGRSMCFSCKTTLQSRDLVPVLSFLWCFGRCRHCKSKISWQYISIEVITAILFSAVYFHNKTLLNLGDDYVFPTLFLIKSVIDCTIMSLLVFMAGYDLRHKIIPDPFVVAFAIFALLSQVIIGAFSWWLLLAGPLLALPFYLIWLFSNGRWMGLGDAKLAIGIGWMLGLSLGGTAIVFGFWIGASISVIALGLGSLMKYGPVRRKFKAIHMPALSFKSEVPFAPFLIAGLLIVYILGYNLFVFVL